MASTSWASFWDVAPEVELRSDGSPNMGFVGVMTGFEERLREARRSLSAGVGVERALA